LLKFCKHMGHFDYMRAFRLCVAVMVATLAVPCLAQPLPTNSKPSLVSANLCADQLVLALADRDQIRSLSPFADDAKISFLAARAQGLPTNSGAAEELIRLSADLVLVGRYDNRLTKTFLADKGRVVAIVDSWVGLGETKSEIDALATRFGAPARGSALIADIDRAMRRIEDLAAQRRNKPSFLILHRRGFVLHAGLAADIAVRAGLRNAAADVGLAESGFADVERIVTARPDYLIVARINEQPEDQGEALLEHPALRHLYPDARRLVVPDTLTICPGPAIPALIDRLADEIAAKVR
jgi:iron complex transport system substrate-binding protein